MSREEVLEAFSGIRVWQNRGRRAPHKPLLTLMMLGRVQRGEARMASFESIRELLGKLLIDLGRPTKPEYPFWYLKNDGFWELENTDKLDFRSGEPSAKQLVNAKVEGGFKSEYYSKLKSDPELLIQVAFMIADAHFPASIQDDVFLATGINVETRVALRKSRDPKFRIEILRAYEYSCAVCGFDVRLDNQPIALEAAHIKWHNANGPDTVQNGLALCTLHHKLFDRGTFTITEAGIILISERVHGSSGFEEWLLRFEKKSIRRPRRAQWYPEPDYLQWHVAEVFQGWNRV